MTSQAKANQAKRRKYVRDPEFRRRRNDYGIAYQKNATGLRKRRMKLSSRVYQVRERIKTHLRQTAALERRLIGLVKELEQVKAAIRAEGRVKRGARGRFVTAG